MTVLSGSWERGRLRITEGRARNPRLLRRRRLEYRLLSAAGMMLRMMTLLMLASAACNSADECLGLCDAPITMLVHGTPGMGAPTVLTIGVAGNCVADMTVADATVCALAPEGPGPGVHRFEVISPGYMSRLVEAVVEPVEAGECGCGYLTTELEITLDPQ